ncbi:hypothetical protein [Geodermatophilus siccatus]|uniref:hypothetical protein n=1 Tax=Geodermatophilus siccatus TaxID=1137991 RepID=UPI000B83B937|nr:hypothetical protein [Geodermatophilus siccatus]
MPARKIVDEQEVIRWFQEGRTYDWMCHEYRRKYGIETRPSLWGNFRRRRGLTRRTVRDDELIPWAVKPEHRGAHALQMLRLEARARAGEPVREGDAARHRNFMRNLADQNAVVEYDPDTPEGFRIVPRQQGDTDVIRRPVTRLTTKHRAD